MNSQSELIAKLFDVVIWQKAKDFAVEIINKGCYVMKTEDKKEKLKRMLMIKKARKENKFLQIDTYDTLPQNNRDKTFTHKVIR